MSERTVGRVEGPYCASCGLALFAGEHPRLIDGPRGHKRHGQQVQVGWIGHKDDRFYPWWVDPSKTEPGGFTPVYVDDDDD